MTYNVSMGTLNPTIPISYPNWGVSVQFCMLQFLPVFSVVFTGFFQCAGKNTFCHGKNPTLILSLSTYLHTIVLLAVCHSLSVYVVLIFVLTNKFDGVPSHMVTMWPIRILATRRIIKRVR